MTRHKPSHVPSDTPNHSDKFGLERLIFFSDAVFAIAITLLALEIRLPASEGLMSDGELAARLVGLWHRYLGDCISFLVIGVFWMAHHRKFRFIKRYDSGLLLLNLLLLMVVASIPFPTSVISEYPYRAATVFYALIMLLVALMYMAIWWYASWHNRLIDADMDTKHRRREFITPLATAFVFLLSVGFAFIDPDVAKFTWLLIVPVTLFMNKYT
jgi:uncharacterized membrane protein